MWGVTQVTCTMSWIVSTAYSLSMKNQFARSGSCSASSGPSALSLPALSLPPAPPSPRVSRPRFITPSGDRMLASICSGDFRIVRSRAFPSVRTKALARSSCTRESCAPACAWRRSRFRCSKNWYCWFTVSVFDAFAARLNAVFSRVRCWRSSPWRAASTRMSSRSTDTQVAASCCLAKASVHARVWCSKEEWVAW